MTVLVQVTLTLLNMAPDCESSLTLCHSAYVIHLPSSPHVVNVSSYIIIRRVSTVQDILKDHIHITFITVYFIVLFY